MRTRHGDTLELPPRARMTPQRRAVLDAIAGFPGHFTAKQVYDRARRRDARLGMATVYRTLELLRSQGLVRPLPGSDAPVFIRCHRGHHHHLICLTCGSVQDTDLYAAPAAAELERRHGFRAESHELDIYGACRECA